MNVTRDVWHTIFITLDVYVMILWTLYVGWLLVLDLYKEDYLQIRSRKCLTQSEAKAAMLVSQSVRKKHKLGGGRWDFPSCQVLLNSVQWLQSRNRNLTSQLERRAAGLPISPKNTNLVEDVEILLPVKFCWIVFSVCREKVETVFNNQIPERPS